MKINNKSSTKYKILNNPPSTPTVVIDNLPLEPAPFVSLSVEQYMAGDYVIGGALNVSLNGVIHGTGFLDTSNKLREKLNIIRDKNNCIHNININCGSGTIITSGVGILTNFNISEGDQKNWMNIIPYSIDLVLFQESGNRIINPNSEINAQYGINNNYIRSLNEKFTIDINDQNIQTFNPGGTGTYSNEHIIIKFNIDAQGIPMCTQCDTSGIPITGGIMAAYNVIQHRLSNLTNFTDSGLLLCNSGTVLITPNTYNAVNKFMEFRTIDVDELNSTISVNGELILRPTGVVPEVLVTLDSTADANLDAGEKNISINGSIRGLTNISFASGLSGYSYTQNSGMAVAETHLLNMLSDSTGIINYLKDKNNLIKFENQVGDYLNRHLSFGSGDGSMSGFQSHMTSDTGDMFRLISKSFKRNHTEQSIVFDLAYSNKNRCKIPYALWAQVSIEHELPARRLVEHVIPGRGYPITQDLLCDTLDSFTITVNAQFEPTRNVHKIINNARATVKSLIDQTATDLLCNSWVRTQDNETIGDDGTYRRTMKLTRHSCFDASSLPYLS